MRISGRPGGDAANGDVYAQVREKLARLALAQGAELPGANPPESGGAAQPCSKEDEGGSIARDSSGTLVRGCEPQLLFGGIVPRNG